MYLQITEPGSSITNQDSHKNDLSKAVGIDLGTTNSIVAFSENGKSRAIKGEFGDYILPSVVAYPKGLPPIVGQEALDLISTIPDYVVASSKRLLGRSHAEALDDFGHIAINIQESASKDSLVKLVVGESLKSPLEVSTDILKAIKRRAEIDLGHPIDKAVITVPAYFDESARQATKDAASLAGLQVLRLVNEPTAAALAYGLDHGSEGIYAIYDLGGGTFDLSLLRLTKGVFQVLATGGDVRLGGDDIDRLIVEYLHHLSPEVAYTTATYKQALKVAREAKEYLSQQERGMWAFPGGQEYPLDRATLEHLTTPLVERTIDICRQVLVDAGLKTQDVQGIVLVGGATRMPLIGGRVAEFFGQSPLTDLDPDQVVALGAALQAEALTHGSKTLLLDVIPLSLGLETMGGVVEKLISRNTPIPTEVTQEFTTYQDGQTAIKIHVLQGEREMTQYCRSLAEFTLTGIPPMKAGLARITVNFTVDADGLLTVSAIEKTSQVRQFIEVKPSYGLSEQELHDMLVENARHGAKDIENRLLIESKLKAEQLLHQLSSALDNDGDLLSVEEKNNLLIEIKNLEQCLTEADRKVIVEQQKRLEDMSVPFAERRIQRLITNKMEI